MAPMHRDSAWREPSPPAAATAGSCAPAHARPPLPGPWLASLAARTHAHLSAAAMTRALPVFALAALLALAACDSPTGGSSAPARVDVVSGNQQAAVAGTELPQPLVVRVVDARARPVSGRAVTFVVTAGGGHVAAGTVVTNADGVAQDRWTLGTASADSQRVEARVVDAAGTAAVLATFSAAATPAAPATLVKLGGDVGTGQVAQPAADSLAVRVVDAFGNGVPGQTVAWSVTAGAATLSPASATTGANGIARARLVFGQAPGSSSVRAAWGAQAVTFAAQAQAPRVAVLAGAGQQAATGTVFADSVAVKVTSEALAPLPGVRVRWTVQNGAVSADSSLTGVDGVARVAVTAGSNATQVVVTAAAGGVQAAAALRATGPLGVEGAQVSADAQGADYPLATVRVSPTTAATTVTATVAGRTTRLAPGSPDPELWSGRLNLAGLAAGPYAVVFTASDGKGHTVQVTAPYSYAPGTVVGALTLVTPYVGPQGARLMRDTGTVVVTVGVGAERVTAMVASAFGRQATLTRQGGSTWRGQLDLAGVPAASGPLLVTASYTGGATQLQVTSVLHDPAPVLGITSPATHIATGSTVRLTAACTDNKPGCQIVVYGPGDQLLASAAEAIDRDIALPAGARPYGIVVYAIDGFGLGTGVNGPGQVITVNP